MTFSVGSSTSSGGVVTVSTNGSVSTTVGTEEVTDGDYTPPCFKVETDNPKCLELETYIEPCFVVTTEFNEVTEDDAPEDGMVEQLKTWGINVVYDVLYRNGTLYVSGIMNATPALPLSDQYAYVWRFSVWTGLNGGIAMVTGLQYGVRVVDGILGLNPASSFDRTTALGGRFTSYGEGKNVELLGFMNKMLNFNCTPKLGWISYPFNGWVRQTSQKVVSEYVAVAPYHYYKTYEDAETNTNVRIISGSGFAQECRIATNDPSFPESATLYGGWHWSCTITLGNELFDLYVANTGYQQCYVVLVRGGEYPVEIINQGEWNERYVQMVDKKSIAYHGAHNTDYSSFLNLQDIHTWEERKVAYLSLPLGMYIVAVDEDTGKALFGTVGNVPVNYIYPALDGKPFLATIAKGKFLTVTTWTENDWQQDALGYYYLSLVHQKPLALLPNL